MVQVKLDVQVYETCRDMTEPMGLIELPQIVEEEAAIDDQQHREQEHSSMPRKAAIAKWTFAGL